MQLDDLLKVHLTLPLEMNFQLWYDELEIIEEVELMDFDELLTVEPILLDEDFLEYLLEVELF